MTKRLAIIPARGGSKRLPRKNIALLRGKPLVTWTIEAANNSKIFDDVFVSTEDNEIASIAASSGALVLNRPKNLSSDSATVVQTCLFHLQELASSGKTYEQLFCLYPTAPMRNELDLQEMASLFLKYKDAASVFAVTDFSPYPFQAMVLDENKKINPFWPDLADKRASE